jgi:hypothetical protein
MVARLLAKIRNNQEQMLAKIDAQARMDSELEKMEAAVELFEERLNKMETTDLETKRGNSEAVAYQQEVPNEEAEVETVGALEGRYGDRKLAVGRRR